MATLKREFWTDRITIHIGDNVTVRLIGSLTGPGTRRTRGRKQVNVLVEEGDKKRFDAHRHQRTTLVQYIPNDTHTPPKDSRLTFEEVGEGERELKTASKSNAPVITVTVHPAMRFAFVDTALK